MGSIALVSVYTMSSIAFDSRLYYGLHHLQATAYNRSHIGPLPSRSISIEQLDHCQPIAIEIIDYDRDESLTKGWLRCKNPAI